MDGETRAEMEGVDIYDMACGMEQGLETGIAERIGDGWGGVI